MWGRHTGDGQDSMLTGDQMGNLQHHLNFASLPRTLQDATVLAHQLGFRCLWIDRYCIDKRSLVDFGREIARMGTYYENGALHLAPLNARSAHDPVFAFRNPLSITTLRLPVEEGPSLWVNSYRNNYEVELEKLAFLRPYLFERAWCLQECLLAPRSVYFGSEHIEGVFWECRQQTSSDHLLFPRKPRFSSFSNTIGSKARTFSALRLHPSERERQLFNKTCAFTVEDCIKCVSSYPGDRWNAIADIANLTAERGGKDMVFGLWVHTLVCDLLWTSYAGLGGILDSQRSDLSPSWSWLSVAQPIHTYHWFNTQGPAEQETIDVQHCGETKSIDVDLTYEPFAAHKRIARAHLVDVLPKLTPSGHKIGCAILAYLPVIRVRNDLENPYDPSSFPVGRTGLGRMHCIAFSADTSADHEATDLHLLPLIVNMNTGQLDGLIIRPYDKVIGYWVRCGTFGVEIDLRPLGIKNQADQTQA